MFLKNYENLFFKKPFGIKSRFLVFFYGLFGLKLGVKNRFEGGRIRRFCQIEIGCLNCFTAGYYIWPEDALNNTEAVKIKIGDNNYFNRNFMIDACGIVIIGDNNMFGPDIYITDSNHGVEYGKSSNGLSMERGIVKIGSNCWLGAKVVILKDVTLGDNCVVGAGAVVTKNFPAGSIIAGVPAKLINSIGS